MYAHPCYDPSAVGPLELANALAACCLSSRLSSQHRQWAAQQLVRTLAAHDRDNQSAPQTLADMGGDLRKCSFIKLEAHQNRVSVAPSLHPCPALLGTAQKREDSVVLQLH